MREKFRERQKVKKESENREKNETEGILYDFIGECPLGRSQVVQEKHTNPVEKVSVAKISPFNKGVG